MGFKAGDFSKKMAEPCTDTLRKTKERGQQNQYVKQYLFFLQQISVLYMGLGICLLILSNTLTCVSL